MNKVDELTDNMILARNIAIGSLVAYAGFHILNRWFLTPFMSTFRFLVNQTSAIRDQLKLKYGKKLIVIAGAASGLGPTYAAYFSTLGYEAILLIDKDVNGLDRVKKKLLDKRQETDGNPFSVYTYQYDFDLDMDSPE